MKATVQDMQSYLAQMQTLLGVETNHNVSQQTFTQPHMVQQTLPQTEYIVSPLEEQLERVTMALCELNQKLDQQQDTLSMLCERMRIFEERQPIAPSIPEQYSAWSNDSALISSSIDTVPLMVRKIEHVIQEEVQEEVPVVQEKVQEEVPVVQEEVPVVQEKQVVQEEVPAVQEEVPVMQEEQLVVKPVQPVVQEEKPVVQEEVPVEEPTVEEEEPAVEEEEGEELEEITFNDETYYKDSEGFIYKPEDLDTPIGYWKEKTGTIAFYRTKK